MTLGLEQVDDVVDDPVSDIDHGARHPRSASIIAGEQRRNGGSARIRRPPSHVQRIREGPEGTRPFERMCGPREHLPAARSNCLADPPHERGLADAGLTGDEDVGPLTAPEVDHQLSEELEVGVPPHQRATRRIAHAGTVAPPTGSPGGELGSPLIQSRSSDDADRRQEKCSRRCGRTSSGCCDDAAAVSPRRDVDRGGHVPVNGRYECGQTRSSRTSAMSAAAASMSYPSGTAPSSGRRSARKPGSSRCSASPCRARAAV